MVTTPSHADCGISREGNRDPEKSGSPQRHRDTELILREIEFHRPVTFQLNHALDVILWFLCASVPLWFMNCAFLGEGLVPPSRLHALFSARSIRGSAVLCLFLMFAAGIRAQNPDPAPYVAEAVFSDSNNNGLADPEETLTLVMTRSVVVHAPLSPASFFLPVQEDSLGQTGFTAVQSPHNTRHIILTLGQGVHLTLPGRFDMQVRGPGSPSGIDLSASLPPGAIQGVTGKDAVDGGAPGVDDSGKDILFTCRPGSANIGAAGGTAEVAVSADAAYTRHSLRVPAGSLTSVKQVTLRPAALGGGVLSAVQIDVQPAGGNGINPGASWDLADPVPLPFLSELSLEYRDSDVDNETGRVEPAMKVHQLVEISPNVFQWEVAPGFQSVDLVNKTVTVLVAAVSELRALGSPNIYAVLPGWTVEPVTTYIKPEAGGGGAVVPGGLSESAATISPGSQGDYTLHRLEIPNYAFTTETDPAGIKITISPATLFHRVSSGGTSFPSEDWAIFVVTTRDVGGVPVAFTSPVNVRAQFMDGTANAYNDLVDFYGEGGPAAKMRVVRDALAGPGADFAFIPIIGQTVDPVARTVEAQGITNLTDSTGEGVWGAVIHPNLGRTSADCWEIYE